MSDFGDILKELRKKEKMTQEELAKALRIPKFAVSGYEYGTRLPSPEMLIKIANVFHVSADYLFGREQ